MITTTHQPALNSWASTASTCICNTRTFDRVYNPSGVSIALHRLRCVPNPNPYEFWCNSLYSNWTLNQCITLSSSLAIICSLWFWNKWIVTTVTGYSKNFRLCGNFLAAIGILYHFAKDCKRVSISYLSIHSNDALKNWQLNYPVSTEVPNRHRVRTNPGS